MYPFFLRKSMTGRKKQLQNKMSSGCAPLGVQPLHDAKSSLRVGLSIDGKYLDVSSTLRSTSQDIFATFLYTPPLQRFVKLGLFPLFPATRYMHP